MNFSKKCKCGSAACLPLFDQGLTEKFPVPPEVIEYFKNIEVKPLCNEVKSLELKLELLERDRTEIKRLKDLTDLIVESFNEISAEVQELQKDLANIESIFQEEDKRFTVLRNLLEANREVTKHFGELAVIKQEFFSLFEQSGAVRKIYFDGTSFF